MSTKRRAFKKNEKDYMWDKMNKNTNDILVKTIPGLGKDTYDNYIVKNKYGDRKSNYGWEGDHGKPLKQGGTYHKNNLQAMQWKDNASKGGKTTYEYRKSGGSGKGTGCVVM